MITAVHPHPPRPFDVGDVVQLVDKLEPMSDVVRELALYAIGVVDHVSHDTKHVVVRLYDNPHVAVTVYSGRMERLST